jgi:hypothetical protein
MVLRREGVKLNEFANLWGNLGNYIGEFGVNVVLFQSHLDAK